MYKFNREEIINHPLHQIEYSIIDICNKNCKSCSHFAPLAKNPNEVSLEEFIKYTKILHNIIPDAHTFWLIGGEPTLHPKYIELLKELRSIYNNIPIGLMSNGYGILVRKDDINFWKFIKDNEIVWRITTYKVRPSVYRDLFAENGCGHLLSLDVNNRFSNLAVLSERKQEISVGKYNRCGWERLNIFVRNGRIWKCPSVEYIDLLNDYFDKRFKASSDDYLQIDNTLTREAILEFKNKPSSFCGNCNISKRYKNEFEVELSKRELSEWMVE